MSEFTEAIRTGNTTRVHELLDEDSSLLQTSENAITPILFAIYHGRTELARLFVERGATVSVPEACALGDRDRVERMLLNDPDAIERRSADGYTPLCLAIFFKHPDLASWLIERGADVRSHSENVAGVAPVHAAAAARDVATMRLLLERGADPNALQQKGYTPLHGAASRGDIEMAQLLLTHGASRLAKAETGETIADAARTHDHAAFAEWIEGN